MQEILAALAEQHRELAGLLDPLTNDAWSRPSRCPGWTVSDVVLHLAQTDELALASLTGSFGVAVDRLADGFTGASSVDEGADAMVADQRGASSSEVRERWRLSSFALLRTLRRDGSQRPRALGGRRPGRPHPGHHPTRRVLDPHR